MSDKLRPHHILCILNFEGKGYSAEFTENMKKVISNFELKNPKIEITMSADVICEKCPHNMGGKCNGYKAEKFDETAAEFLNISQGKVYSWNFLKELALDSVICKGRLCDICRDCQWAEICIKTD